MTSTRVCPVDLCRMEQIDHDLYQCSFCGRTELCLWEESQALDSLIFYAAETLGVPQDG